MSNVATIHDKSRSVTVFMAERYGMEPAAFEATLRATCIKPDRNGRVPTREEFAAFLLVAKEYGLNPLTKEIYAFTDNGAVVPIVSVDGWSNLINSSPHFDGMDFVDKFNGSELVAITCNMFRKDRARPVSVTEYMAECKRDTAPWRRWPARMLRHKAMIQAARYCFGFAGIYDDDEGERIIEAKAISALPLPPDPQVPQVEGKKNSTPVSPKPGAGNGSAAAPPVPPVPPVPPKQPGSLLIDRYREAVAAAQDGDALDAAWNDIVQPHMQSIDKEMYEALMAIDDAARGRLEA